MSYMSIISVLKESASVKVLAAISFCDIYTERSALDPERFQRAHRCISDKQFTQFVSPPLLLSLSQCILLLMGSDPVRFYSVACL